MNVTSNIDDINLTFVNPLIDLKTTTTTNVYHSTKLHPTVRPTVPIFSSNKYFIFRSSFNRNIRYAEIPILSLALPLYAIVFALFIELMVLRISRNTAISGGGTRSRTQRSRQRMRSLIWTLNYLIIDFLNLIYEIIYVSIHLSGILTLESIPGRFYCQLQVYLPLYLTVLMAYSLTAISIYRRRHFVNFNDRLTQTFKKSFLMICALWIMPIVTIILPALLLVYFKILKITNHETTNQCQISVTYQSNMEAIFIFYRLGNIFLLPISISLACYLAIYVDLIRMQRRFNRTFKRHLHIRKNLILQILFLFLNFAVFWLPAELIMISTKNPRIKDAAQVIKSLNILLDPLVITFFDTRLSSAGRQLLSTWPFNQFTSCLNNDQQQQQHQQHSLVTIQSTTIRRRETDRFKQSATWNIANNDDITVLESVSNHSLQNQKSRMSDRQRRNRRRKRIKTVENHV